MLLVQITDPHLRADGVNPRHDPVRALAAAVAAVNRMRPRPDLVVLTGDILDRSNRDHGPAVEILSDLRVPLLPLTGNHDDPAAFRAAFGACADYAPDHVSAVVPLAGGAVIALDSNDGRGGAGLDPTRLAWLAGALARNAGPVVLALHHPPFLTGIPRLDRAAFAGRDRLETAVRGSNVVRLLAGHTHRAISADWAGIPASTCPALGHALALSLDPESPHAHSAEAPAMQLHLIRAGGCVTHTVSPGAVRGFAPLTQAQRAALIDW